MLHYLVTLHIRTAQVHYKSQYSATLQITLQNYTTYLNFKVTLHSFIPHFTTSDTTQLYYKKQYTNLSYNTQLNYRLDYTVTLPSYTNQLNYTITLLSYPTS